MIQRIYILLIILILLPYWHIYMRIVRKYAQTWGIGRLIYWCVPVGMVVYTLYFKTLDTFIPLHIWILRTYFILFFTLVMPALFMSICMVIAQIRHRIYPKEWGSSITGRQLKHYSVVAGAATLLCWFTVIWGVFIGFYKRNTHTYTLQFDNLPPAFDQYKIVQISDWHVGTLANGRIEKIYDDCKAINALKPDLILFTGDLQNQLPDEIASVSPILKTLRAKDGIISILGNHDYPQYTYMDERTEQQNLQKTVKLEQELGWKVLRNEHIFIRKGQDSIAIIGLENYKKPDKMDLQKAIKGMRGTHFSIIMEHQPDALAYIMKQYPQANLTLFGHTHGGQINLFGIRPTMFSKAFDRGLHRNSVGSYANVNTGLGGLLPMRINVPAEITVFTLKTTNKRH